MADSAAFASVWVNPAVRSDAMVAKDFKLHMRPYQHDILEVELRGMTDMDANRWSAGTPVLAKYGRNPNSWDQFYGYLVGTSRDWEQTQRMTTRQRTMKMWAVGASWPLKEGLQAVYRGITSSQLAATVAMANYFDVDSPATDYLWPALSSPGDSNWQFLCAVAKKSGLTCHMHGTQLRYYDPMTILKRGNVTIPSFVEKDGAVVGTVLNFETDLSEVESVEGRRRRNRVIKGTDAITGSDIVNMDDGSSLGISLGARRLPSLFTEYVTDVVVENQADAQALLAPVTTANRFWNRARATLSGDVRVTQETPILITGLGSRDSGLWQALSVIHHLKYQWYDIQVELGRDSDYDNGVRPGLASGIARAHLDPNATESLTNPGTALINGRWRSLYTSTPLPVVA